MDIKIAKKILGKKIVAIIIIKIKKIDLTPDFLKLIDSFSKLPPSQRESIAWMLKRSGKK